MASLKQSYFHGPYLCQNWSLPNSVVYNIAKYPSSAKTYQKLIKTCKYFFSKNPIIVATELFCSWDQKFFISLNHKLLNISNVSKKLWITDKFNMSLLKNTSSSISSITSKICRIAATEINFGGHQFSLNDYLLLSSKAYEVIFCQTIVRNDDGTIVPIETLVEALPKVKSFIFYNNPDFSSVTTDTAEKLLELQHFSKLDEFRIIHCSEAFDIETFFAYAKKNKQTHFIITFLMVSDAYKLRLDTITDEMLAIKNNNYKIPLFHYSGMTSSKFSKLRALYGC